MTRITWAHGLLVVGLVLAGCDGSGGDGAGDQGAVVDASAGSSGAASANPSESPSEALSEALSEAPSEAPSEGRTIGPVRNVVPVRGARLPEGQPPRVPYVAGLSEHVVVRPDGVHAAVLEVDPYANGFEGYRHLSFAPFAGGWLTAWDAEGSVATIMRPDGAMGDRLGAGPFEVFSRRDRSEVVFSYSPSYTMRRVVAVLGPSGRQRVGPAASTAGFLGKHQVVVTKGGSGAFRVDLRDGSWTPIPEVDEAVMVSSRSGWLIGRRAYPHGGPDLVHDARTGEVVLAAPGYRLAGFSPSGRLVVGLARRSGQRFMVVAEVATGRVVRAFRLRGVGWSPETPPVWEDERSLLVGGGRFVRLRLDGTVERADVVDAPIQCCAYLLPAPVS